MNTSVDNRSCHKSTSSARVRAASREVRGAVTALATVAALSTIVTGCHDRDEAPAAHTVGRSAPLCISRSSGPTPLRRLTRSEYGRTLRDLIGPGLVDTSSLPPDEQALGFDNNADVLGTSDLLVEQTAALAEQASAAVIQNLGRFLPCASASTTADSDCAVSFIRDFGRLVWRRPLEPAELTALGAVLAAGQTQGVAGTGTGTGQTNVGFAEGIGRAVEVLLESPQFLYRIELGVAAGPVVTPGLAPAVASDLAGAVPLSPYETATRLSYLIWGSTPDESLLTAAEQGRLALPEDLSREAQRLLADPRAHEVTAAFHAGWLGLSRLDQLDKDRVVYPTFDLALRDDFRTETSRFIDEVIWNREGTLSALLSARYSFVDSRLADFYGVSYPGTGDFVEVGLGSANRAGLLTQASILAAYAKANQSSPVHRGRFVREQLLCTTPPPPPSNIEIRPPTLDPRLTTRDRFAAHTADPFCATCHSLLDPIGFGFEHYDGLGHWRQTESGLAIDAQGLLTGTDSDGPFDGAVALADRLARSPEVQRCYVTQWFRFGYGRSETTDDACTLASLMDGAAATGGDVRKLMVALTQTDAFRYRRAPEVTSP